MEKEFLTLLSVPRWWGETEVIRMDKEAVSLQIFPPSDAWKEETLQWMSGLPLALENDETRSEPSTLNPQPSTLNPQPSTLNPQPSTPNPKP